jgi:hypothetical protein
MDGSKRSFMKALPFAGVGAAFVASAIPEAARAQQTGSSTYDEVIKRGALRLGVINIIDL